MTSLPLSYNLVIVVTSFLLSLTSMTMQDFLGLSSPSSGETGMSLWIDEKQVKEYSGFPMMIHVIADGVVLPYVMDPNLEKHLPVIPPEVGYVNFTWTSGEKKPYIYNFDQLLSYNTQILSHPFITIPTEGRVPKEAKVFAVNLPCLGNVSGTVSFAFGLKLYNETGIPLPGTPLRLKLRKQCLFKGQNPDCDRNCINGGWCNEKNVCQCPKGFIGEYCHSAFCYPICLNGGSCVSPGQCSCLEGFQGPHCEGGICREKCLNGGKCIQKDTCQCTRGYYGDRCQFSKCVPPCLNRGKCLSVNQCRCRRPFSGPQCQHLKASFSGTGNSTNTRNRRRKKKRKKFV